MKVALCIRTDTLVICERIVEAPSTLRAVLEALRAETTAHQHLGDLPFARLSISARPETAQGAGRATLNQEANG